MLNGGLITRRHVYSLLRVLLLLTAMQHVSYGDTIISVSGPVLGGHYPLTNSQVAASSWISPRTYTGVDIAALLTAEAPDIVQPGVAYLMSKIGPGTTIENEIARSIFSFPTDIAPVTLFTGLTLPAGTYYLVLASSGGGGWRDAYECGLCPPPPPPQQIILDAGVTRNMDLLAAGPESVNAYPPASSFVTGTGIHGDPFFQYSVTTVTAVPEPATLAMLGSGLLSVGLHFSRVGKKHC